MRFVCSMIIFSSSAISARGIFCSKSRTYFNPTNCAAFSLSSAAQCEKLAASACVCARTSPCGRTAPPRMSHRACHICLHSR